MIEDRYYDLNGSRSHCPSALSWDICAAHGWTIPRERALRIAEWLWSIPDDTLFRWKVADMMTETPAGMCAKCGVGWAGFIACDPANACEWQDIPGVNPSPAWPPINTELSPLVRADYADVERRVMGAQPAADSLDAGGPDGWGAR